MDMLSQVLGGASPKEYDIRLPKLGLMRFHIAPAEKEGVYIMYFKKMPAKEGFVFNPLEPDESSLLYCYAKVELNELEKTFNAKMQKKVLKKIDKLKAWLIQQDLLLSQIQTNWREVRL